MNEHVDKAFCELQHKNTGDRLSALGDSVRDIAEDVRAIDRAINKGNGKPALTITIDRHERFITVMLWGGGVVGGAILTGVVGLFWKMAVLITNLSGAGANALRGSIGSGGIGS